MRTSIDVWRFAGGDWDGGDDYLSRFHVWEKKPGKGGVVERISATITFRARTAQEAQDKAEAWRVSEQARQAASEVLRAKKRLPRNRRAPQADAGA